MIYRIAESEPILQLSDLDTLGMLIMLLILFHQK